MAPHVMLPPPTAEGSCHALGQLPLQFAPVKPNLFGATENTKSTSKSSTSCTVPSKKLSALWLLHQTQEAQLNRAACSSLQPSANITGYSLHWQRRLQSSATHLGSLNIIKNWKITAQRLHDEGDITSNGWHLCRAYTHGSADKSPGCNTASAMPRPSPAAEQMRWDASVSCAAR